MLKLKTFYPFSGTAAGYQRLWNRATVLPQHLMNAATLARTIGDAAHRPHFAAVEKATGVPWFMVGLLLMRESSLNMGTYLGNGQPLDRVTTEVPVGRGPFSSFEAGAIDALAHEGMTGITEWSVSRILYWMERFNGQGYFSTGINSPYLWSWTNLYVHGKFSSDGHFDPGLVDPQPGCAAVLKVLQQANADVAAYLAAKQEPPVVTPAPTQFPQFPQISLAEIQTGISLAEKVLPFVGMIFPPAAPFVALVPIIDQMVQAFTQIQSGGSLEATLAAALRNAANQLDVIAGKAPPSMTVASALPTNMQP